MRPAASSHLAPADASRRGRRIPRGLVPVLAPIALDLLIRQAAWRWWPWPAAGPEQSVERHVPFDLGTLLRWVASPLVPVRPRHRVVGCYAEGDPTPPRTGAVVILLGLLLATSGTLSRF